jgi:hypothetical protein
MRMTRIFSIETAGACRPAPKALMVESPGKGATRGMAGMVTRATLLACLGCLVGTGPMGAAAQQPGASESIAGSAMVGPWTGELQTRHGPSQMSMIVEPDEAELQSRALLGLGGPPEWRDLNQVRVDGEVVTFATSVPTTIGDAVVTFTGTLGPERIEGTFRTSIRGQEFATGTWWAERGASVQGAS